jgi:hypothetical protein
MAKQTINIGAYELDTNVSVDTIRAAFNKANENFNELYNTVTTDYNDLLNTPVIPADVSDLTDTTNLLQQEQDLTNIEIETQTLGRKNISDQYIPFVISDSIQSTLQDQIPPTNIVGGNIEKVVYTKELDRYTSGGELLLTFICNTGSPKVYLTKKYVFSRNESETFDVVEIGSSGTTTLYDSIEIVERLVDTDLFFDITVTAPNSGLPSTEFVRVIGQITYTSVPIFLTASGY